MKSESESPQKSTLDTSDERIIVKQGIRGAIEVGISRIRSGDLGALPIIVGIVLVWTFFGITNPIFLSSTNLANLLAQCASDGIIALGIVLVLLLGQIDLSVGSMAGVGSSIVGVGYVLHGWSTDETILIVLVAGISVGLIYSFVFLRFEVPSFVITLVGLLVLLGIQLQLVGQTGSINIPFTSPIVRFMESDDLGRTFSYVLSLFIALAYAGTSLAQSRRRRIASLSNKSLVRIILPPAALLVCLEFSCWYINRSEGINDGFVLFVSLVVIMDILLRRTQWGRAVYAVGGSREAARRAGIKVNLVYISVFVLCAMFAALGGLLEAARLGASSVEAGTGNVNLNAIAAAVIGGTSLFGGRGSAYSALFGITIIESIANGLDLLNLSSAEQFMITGGVLMVAVIVDSVSQRARKAHGRA